MGERGALQPRYRTVSLGTIWTALAGRGDTPALSLTSMCWSGLPFPPPGDLPDPGIKTASQPPALAGRFFTTGTTWAMVKNSSANAKGTRDTGPISESGRSSGGGQGKLTSILARRIPMDRGAW